MSINPRPDTSFSPEATLPTLYGHSLISRTLLKTYSASDTPLENTKGEQIIAAMKEFITNIKRKDVLRNYG